MWNSLQASRPWIVAGALLAALAVAAGAYGWHALKADQAMRDIFMLAVQYHMWHSLALIAVGWRCTQGAKSALWAAFAGIAFVIGIVLFCGNLYDFAATGNLLIPGAAPVGGFSFMAGWVLLAVSALVKPE
jgi:uncharacterized membrane protein YgdD (TMEM256/DUF423 family)